MDAGQIDRRRVDKHTKLLCGTVDLGRDTVYQELLRVAEPTNWRTTPSGWKRLTVSHHLSRLEGDGIVMRTSSRWRSCRLL
ncbi:putative response regulator receiver protein [Streptomyces sp. Tu6071]|nr:putative response regulator receiver protein [Streptomyces sp. Tu6071]